MTTLETDGRAVQLPLAESPRGWLVGGVLLALLPLAVAVSAHWHPVRWWGWLAAAVFAVVAVLVMCHRPRLIRVVAVDDLLVLADRTGATTIPATAIDRLVSFNDSPSACIEVGDEHIALPLKPLWMGTAYPTPRILGMWVRGHGGGRGSRDVDPVEAIGRRRRLARAARKPAVWLVFVGLVGAWVASGLCMAALFGQARPRWDGSWGSLAGVLFVTLARAGASRRVTKVWT